MADFHRLWPRPVVYISFWVRPQWLLFDNCGRAISKQKLLGSAAMDCFHHLRPRNRQGRCFWVRPQWIVFIICGREIDRADASESGRNGLFSSFAAARSAGQMLPGAARYARSTGRLFAHQYIYCVPYRVSPARPSSAACSFMPSMQISATSLTSIPSISQP